MLLKFQLIFNPLQPQQPRKTLSFTNKFFDDSQNKLNMVVFVCNGLMLKGDIWVPENGTCDMLIASDFLSFNFSAIQ